MRLHMITTIGWLCLTTMAAAQTIDRIPGEIGNRANGFSYQPTPGEVVPREQQAGIRPSSPQEKAMDADLDRMYNSLMREYRQGPAAPAR
jgi:hypothetical protein